MNATTPEVVKVLQEHNFNISGATFDGGTVSTLHRGITDAEGRSAMVEFVDGDIKIYEGRIYRFSPTIPPFPR